MDRILEAVKKNAQIPIAMLALFWYIMEEMKDLRQYIEQRFDEQNEMIVREMNRAEDKAFDFMMNKKER